MKIILHDIKIFLIIVFNYYCINFNVNFFIFFIYTKLIIDLLSLSRSQFDIFLKTSTYNGRVSNHNPLRDYKVILSEDSLFERKNNENQLNIN